MRSRSIAPDISFYGHIELFSHQVYGVNVDDQIAPRNAHGFGLRQAGPQRSRQGLPLACLKQKMKAVDTLDPHDRRARRPQHAHLIERDRGKALPRLAAQPAASSSRGLWMMMLASTA